MKYKLKLNYTENELRELKELERHYDSPMVAIHQIVDTEDCDDALIKLWEKFGATDYKDEFKFMTDINNVVMGTAIFPDNLYIIHDTNTNCVIYHDDINNKLDWGPLTFYRPVKNTKEDWLAINPAYESMLERY